MDYNYLHARPTFEDEPDWSGCLHNLIYTFLWIAVILICLFMCSCTTTRYVPVVEHRTDTVQITRQQRDSIWLHDSIYVHEYQKGDTTFLLRDRWHTQYIEKKVTDTTYISIRDTIPCPYPVEVKVPAELNWWQRLRLWLGNILLAVLVIAAGYGAFRLYAKIQSGGVL